PSSLAGACSVHGRPRQACDVAARRLASPRSTPGVRSGTALRPSAASRDPMPVTSRRQVLLTPVLYFWPMERDPLRETVAVLVDNVDDLHRELAELRKR